MSEETAEAELSIARQFAGLPRWVRIALPAIFLAECALLAAGLVRGPAVETDVVRVELPSPRPAPGFSTL